MEVHNPDGASVHEPPLEPIDAQAPEPDYTVLPEAERFAPPNRNKKHRGRKPLLILLILVLVAAAGAAAYWFAKPKHPVKMGGDAVQTHAPVAPSSPVASGTITYTAKGQDLNLSFVYPSNWTAVPDSGSDTTDQPITVTSPLASLTDASGQTVTGKIVFSVRPASSDISELASNSPVAALDSTQFAYTAPTPVQHQYPYLTYVHFSNGSKAPGAFEEVFVTGVDGYNKGDVVSGINSDPVISASFYQCTTQACTGSGTAPLSITGSIWQNSDFMKQVQSILASLKLN